MRFICVRVSSASSNFLWTALNNGIICVKDCGRISRKGVTVCVSQKCVIAYQWERSQKCVSAYGSEINNVCYCLPVRCHRRMSVLMCRRWQKGVIVWVSKMTERCHCLCVRDGRKVSLLMCQRWQKGVIAWVSEIKERCYILISQQVVNDYLLERLQNHNIMIIVVCFSLLIHNGRVRCDKACNYWTYVYTVVYR